MSKNYLKLLFIFIPFLYKGQCNIALNKPSISISNYSKDISAHAFDGITDVKIGTWNSGQYVGVNKPWIAVNLNGYFTINSINLYVNQTPNGATTHNIYTSQSINGPWVLVDSFSGITSVGQKITRTFNTPLLNIGAIKVETTQSPSWVAWTEIEVMSNENLISAITPQGNTIFCQGGSVNLNATAGSNYAYQWYNNNQIINGATASTYQASTSGNYSVKITDGACNATSSAKTVTVNQYPSSGVNVSGNTTFCQGGSVTLITQGAGSYLWSNGETSQSIVVNQSGTYSVAVTANGCTSNSNQTSITVNPLPTATITPQGNTTFCQGGFVNLVANGGTSYQWNTSSTSASITASQSGTYTVNVFNQYNCQATASQVVTVNPLPNVTMNALNNVVYKSSSPIQLVANPNGGTFSGDGVQGTTFNPSLTTLGTKTITYNYTSPQGCSSNSVRSTIVVDSIGNVCSTYDTLKIKVKLTTGINTNQYTSMRVYPNPTSDVLVIDAADVQALNGYRYRILDILSKEVYNALITSAKTEISLKSLGAKGVYVLHIMDANNASIQTKQIVLE